MPSPWHYERPATPGNAFITLWLCLNTTLISAQWSTQKTPQRTSWKPMSSPSRWPATWLLPFSDSMSYRLKSRPCKPLRRLLMSHSPRQPHLSLRLRRLWLPLPYTPTYITLNPQALTIMIAQIVAQTLAQQPLPLPSVVNFPVSLLQATAPITHRSEKLPDTAEYDEDRDRLNAWEQSLRQRLNMNHDRYLTDCEKKKTSCRSKSLNVYGSMKIKKSCSVSIRLSCLTLSQLLRNHSVFSLL